MWTLEEGLEFIRTLQPGAAKLGYNLSLGGGVLNAGHSDHDLDVVVAPAKDAKPDPEAFITWVAEAARLNRIKPRRRWNASMLLLKTTDHKERLIDFFIVDAGASVPFWLQAEADRKVADGH